jgi:GAF domain
MANFEVHIPAPEPGGFNLTLKVSAENWMAALKAGMQKLGEQGASAANVMVDIQEDNSIHVTDSATGRVFRIRELNQEENARAPLKRSSGIHSLHGGIPTLRPSGVIPPAALPASDFAKTIVPGQMPVSVALTQPAMPSTQPTAPISPDKAKTMEAVVPAQLTAAATQPAVTQPELAQAPFQSSESGFRSSPSGFRRRSGPRIDVGQVEELEHPVDPPPPTIGRAKNRSSPDVAAQARREVESLYADVFFRMPEFHALRNIDQALEFVLGLAMDKISCESGSVLRADAASGDLVFVTAKGPKSKELLRANFVVPAGTGIAGFCSFEGVSVALNDAQKDPRFYAEIGEKLGYKTKSMLCAPMMTHGRSLGCIQLINRTAGPQFLDYEMGLLSYLSHQAALYLNRQV